jgi:tetratricopeptide (TPR) repeat protein
MRASSLTLSLAFLLGSAVAASAFAQQPSMTVYPSCTPTKADSDAAHGAYIAGKGSFDENDYARAVDYFKDAYRRDCTKHDLLNIIARAYELKGDRAEAVNALETYLKRVPPNEPGNEQIQRRIASLKAQIAAAPPTPTPVVTAPVEPVPSTPASMPPANAPPDRVTTERTHSVGPWVLVGVGGAAAVAGIVLLVVGQGKISDSKTGCPTIDPVTKQHQCLPGVNGESLQSEGNTLSAVGGVVGGVGIAAVAGGLIWHFTEPTGPETRARIRPDVRPGYAGLTVGAHF